MKHRLSLLFFLLTLTAAAQITPNLYSGMRWRMIGPFRGGRALTAAGVPGQRDVYYFGAVGGGVWKTTNAGETWQPIFDSQPIASIGSLAVAPSDPNVIYVGTGEASIRSDITFGNGVYKSSDAGRTWQHLGLDDTRHIGRVLVDPKDPNIVFVAALGHAYGPNAERGVFRSTDGGHTWQKVLYKDENTGAIDLAFDPENSRIVYATLWNAHRPPWSTYAPVQGPGSGLYRSTDGGTHWTEITGNGLPTHDWGRAGIATTKANGATRIYLLLDTLNGRDGGLYRSDDNGAHWALVGTDRRIYGRQWYFAQLTVDPKNPDVVYVPNVSLYKSTDAGKTFAAIKGAPGGDDYHFLWIDPEDPRRMITASDQGTVISVDGGVSWSSWYNQPTAQFYHVATDNQFPYYVYGAQQDSGTVATASRSDYGSITYRNWYSVGGGESGYIAPDLANPNTVYAGDTYGRLNRFDKITGESQDISPTPIESFGTGIADRKLRFTWTSPVVASPQDPRTVYMGAQYVLRSTDQGHSWQKISSDLTGCDRSAGVPPATPTTAAPSVANTVSGCYGAAYTIAPSPKDANLIWAGTDTGRIYLTRDGGRNWENVMPPNLGDWSKISLLDASPSDAATAYAAVDRHRLDDFAPHILRTHDYGKTWTEVTRGIPAPAFARAVREDPLRKGLLYAGTELGVYVSFDDGGQWLPLQLNLPITPVHDLVVHGDDLVVATHGRSFWILDNLAPLRQITPETASGAAFLFAPPKTYRVRSEQQHDTPLPPEFPAGKNPPAGAILDYYLARPQDEVTLEILNPDGFVVRRYSSRDQQPAHETVAIPEYWFTPPPKLETGAGEHRFAWDLRYPSPPALAHGYGLSAVYGTPMVASPRGPLVLPGNYQVRLTAGGQSYTQPLTIEMDPRLSVPPAGLRAQFDLERSLVSGMEASWKALQEVRQFRQQNPARAQEAAAFEGGRGPGAPRGDTFASLNGAMGGLLSTVDSADAAPTMQAEQAFSDLSARLDALLAKWQQFKAAGQQP
jgi:photosystem II stability/assembly factor-like uncharacterized protein